MKKLAGLLTVLILAGCSGEPPKQEQKPPVSTQPDTVAKPMEQPPDTAQQTVAGLPKETPKSTPVSISRPSVERNVTIIGDIVDIVGYATSGVVPNSPAGREITEASAKGGNPLGILEQSTGQVYIVTMKQANTSANGALLPFIGTKVAAKGDVYRKGQQRLLILTVVGKHAG